MKNMKICKNIVLIVLAVLCAEFAFAGGFTKVPDVKLLEKKVLEYSKKVGTIKSDFIQIKHLEALEVTVESKGKFWFKKENFLRWEYIEPYKYVIAIKNGTFTINDGKKTSSYDTESNKVFKEINNLIISSVRGNLLMDGNFAVEAFESETQYKVKLVPKIAQMKEVLSQIEMYFEKSDMSVSKVKMIEDEDNYTEIKFTNRKFNEDIPTETFTVK